MSAGQEAHRRGDLSAGFACFARAAELDPTLTEAWYMAGGMYIVSGNDQAAEPYLRRALEVQPDHAHALFESGNLHLNRGRAAQALPLFVASVAALEKLATHPGKLPRTLVDEKLKLLPIAYTNHGNCLTDLRRPTEALAAFQRAAAGP